MTSGPGGGTAGTRGSPLPAAVLCVLLGCLAALAPGALAAQDAPSDRGVVAAGLLLRQLDGVKRVLVVGAHPDDEDTSLLATLARGRGARVGYLSLTRGEGGQNLIGPELDEGLGLVRTGELLAARRLDGAEQHFTRAFDFGYSKDAAETLDHWPREEVLRDVVWVVRTFRPQVVVTMFSGTPDDGHGQHQVAGRMAREAFDAAGDPERFPDQLRDGVTPWEPLKLYRRRFGRRFFGEQEVPEGSTVAVATGRYDPLLGRSWFQLAMDSRSQHRSQDMGRPRLPGPRVSGFELVESRAGPIPPEMEQDLFQGVDTALVSLADGVGSAARPELTDALARYRTGLGRARENLDALEPGRAAPHLAATVREAERALELARDAGAPHATAVLERRLGLARRALLAAASVSLDVRVEDGLLVPGEEVRVEVDLWNGGTHAVEDARAALELPPGWKARPIGTADSTAAPLDPDAGSAPEAGTAGSAAGARVRPGDLHRWSYWVTVSPEAGVSQPYFLREPMEGDLYRWPDDRSLWARPRIPPPIRGVVELALEAGGEPVRLRAGAEGEHVEVEEDRGELRTRVLVASPVSLRLRPGSMAWPLGLREEREARVLVRNEEPEGLRGTLRLRAPEGWSVEPDSVPVRLGAPGAEATVDVRVRPGPGLEEGRHALRAELTDGRGRTFRRGFDLVDYDHIGRWALFGPAETEISAFPVRVSGGLRVGYVMGSGDAGLEAIRQLGVDVELLGSGDLRGGDLDRFDVLVLGVRAYETRPDLAAANDRVLAFARGGGTVIVQYNKHELPRGGYAPYPVEMGRPHDRVTDPEAPVTFLAPESPVLNRPNRIDREDFRGWVQERGLYFLSEWDERYTPILAMADPGEEPKRGSLVVATVGDGVWVYTGLAFFRQLPAGVPGAYRLFANLLSLTGEAWEGPADDGGGGG